MDDERALVEGVLRGQSAPFVTLVRRYQALVFYVMTGLIENPADREELCQETFLRVHRKLHTFRYGSLKAWIARIARNVALNHLRLNAVRQERQTVPLSPVHEARPDVEAAEGGPDRQLMAERLRTEVDRLPDPAGTIVKLYYFEELSISEIETALEIPAGTVKSHLFRARQALRKGLEEGTGGIKP